jgi:hypothetical protein
MVVKQERQLVEPDLRQTQSPRIQLGNKKRQKPVAPVPASHVLFSREVYSLTVTCFGLASSALGSVTVRMPSL